MKKILGGILIALQFFVYSCKESNSNSCDQIDYHQINNVIRANIPYYQDQRIAFTSNEGELIMVNVEVKDTVFRWSIPRSCEDYIEVNLTYEESGNSFGGILVRGHEPGSFIPDSSFQFGVINPRGTGWSIYGQRIMIAEDGTLSSDTSHYINNFYHEEIEFNNQTYNNVLEVRYDTTLTGDDYKMYQVFYNKEYGFLGFVTSSQYRLEIL